MLALDAELEEPGPSEAGLAPNPGSLDPGSLDPGSSDPDGFRVSLDGFDGPFDLLLSLISKHELDITEISLSLVTDEFIAYLAGIEGQGLIELERASEFLVVAATLLDLKVASLLPQGEVVDAEDVALLEARDLLFARLLQYRAPPHALARVRLRAVGQHEHESVELDGLRVALQRVVGVAGEDRALGRGEGRIMRGKRSDIS